VLGGSKVFWLGTSSEKDRSAWREGNRALAKSIREGAYCYLQRKRGEGLVLPKKQREAGEKETGNPLGPMVASKSLSWRERSSSRGLAMEGSMGK